MQILQFRKSLLDNFWNKFGGRINYGVGYDANEKLQELIKLANVVLWKRKENKRNIFRKKFNNYKRFKRYFKKWCFICQNEMIHRHHIIQLNNGGDNSKRNILALCLKHHKLIHPWL